MMKKYIVTFLIINISLFVCCKCKEEDITAEEFVGTYVMNCQTYIDTLIIKQNGLCYHSSTMADDKISNISQNGTWRETVQGYFEVTLIRVSQRDRRMDIKPEKCSRTGKIKIPVTTNDFCFYEKVK